MNKMILPIIILTIMLIPLVNADSQNQKTVPLCGLIESWNVHFSTTGTTHTYILSYGGLSCSNLTFILEDLSDDCMTTISIEYTQNMDIRFPSIILNNVNAESDRITYSYEIPILDSNITTTQNTPGFELLLFIIAMIIFGIIYKIKKKR